MASAWLSAASRSFCVRAATLRKRVNYHVERLSVEIEKIIYPPHLTVAEVFGTGSLLLLLTYVVDGCLKVYNVLSSRQLRFGELKGVARFTL
jgi:hypothetical protein